MDWLKNFLNQLWVKIVCIVMWVVATAVLIYDGVTVGQLNDVAKLIVGVGTAIALLITAIRALLQKKDTDKK
jgi:hypothetical protein